MNTEAEYASRRDTLRYVIAALVVVLLIAGAAMSIWYFDGGGGAGDKVPGGQAASQPPDDKMPPSAVTHTAPISDRSTMTTAGGTYVLQPAIALGAGDRAVECPTGQVQHLHVVLALALQNEPKLLDLMDRASDPKATLSQRTISPTTFDSDYAPSEAQVTDVEKFLASKDISRVESTKDRLLVSADMTLPVAEAAFGTKLTCIQTHDGRMAFAYTRDVVLPNYLRGEVVAVLGLQSLYVPHALIQRVALMSAVHDPADFATIYEAGHTRPATDVAVGIIAVGDVNGSLGDLKKYASQHGLPPVATTVIGPVSYHRKDQREWNLDSQAILGMAGAVHELVFFVSPEMTQERLTEAYDAAASYPTAKVIDVSIGECETHADVTNESAAQDQIFLKAALVEGQTFSVASGDHGIRECEGTDSVPSWPASSRYVVSVGGTTLTSSGTRWIGEVAWNTVDDGVVWATGGGPSTFERMPSWQKRLDQNPGHTARDVPDLAYDADGDTGAWIIIDGQRDPTPGGGTSLSAPLFAGAWARVLEEAGTDVGFAAPLLYQLPRGDFHGVGRGENQGAMGRGWNYMTGRGSPIVGRMVTDIKRWRHSHKVPEAAHATSP